MCYTNAGHIPPLLIRQQQGAGFLAENACTILGIDDEAYFTFNTLTMQPGDMLLLYTDGVSEAFNARREQFSSQRLQQEVSSRQNSDAQGFITAILQQVRRFCEDTPQSDDITLLALMYQQSQEYLKL